MEHDDPDFIAWARRVRVFTEYGIFIDSQEEPVDVIRIERTL